MLNLNVPLTAEGWALCPGPLQMDEEMSSLDVMNMDDITQYRPEAIAQTLLSFPGLELLHPAEPEWQQWRARWRSQDRAIDIDISLLGEEEYQDFWGGSGLNVNCNVSDVLALWKFVLSACPGVWLLNDSGDMHTPQSFVEYVLNQPSL